MFDFCRFLFISASCLQTKRFVSYSGESISLFNTPLGSGVFFFCYAHQNGSLAGQKLHRFISLLGFRVRLVKCRTKPLLHYSLSPIPILRRALHQPCIDYSPPSSLRWWQFWYGSVWCF
ncbi:hypothetical protein VNO78_04543 [Psophocarpus tetragonolobus]|uniref:Uncharacterized protein n=1 Tax=Psophocarpus tetragonolobus TaxID=3891 RepID=A0AAN9TF00_PSOTE